MSTKKLPRTAKQDPSTGAAELATRRARTKLLVGPTLEALRSYRRAVIAHVDANIARLEQLEAWTAGAAAPKDCERIGQLAARVCPGLDVDQDEAEQLGQLVDGPVQFCEVAILEVTRQAFGDEAPYLSTAATQLRTALAASVPSSDPASAELLEVLAAFERNVEANGIDVEADAPAGAIEHAA